ncbi:hypothetical protein NL445_28595, partial [Klebsiella pneumoniae]|nr:hypothetical protein [Klebsiella pneumoniae]MCP6198996.1 hypothetical protein [Klebsiella pneumoniae]
AVDIMNGLLAPTTSWIVQFEGPQEITRVLELFSNSEDLMDEVLNTDNVVFVEPLLNNAVGSDWYTLPTQLGESTFVY